jgi:putative ABC transport system substrate-binding protein
MNKNKYLPVFDVRRRLLAAGAALPVLAWAGMARAQTTNSAQKSVRIGILTEGTSTAFQALKPLFDRMQELGYVEGRNVTYDKANADGDLARLPELAKALVARRPDVIYVVATQPSLAVASATRTIPIVFSGVTNPDQRGLVKSLRQPGGNVTGTAQLGALGGKRLQLLKQAVPKIVKVGVLVNPGYSPTSSEDFRLIEQAARILGISIVSAQVADAKELDAAFTRFAQYRVDAILPTQNPLFNRERQRVLEFAAKQRIPVVGASGTIDGAMMSYNASSLEQMHNAARLIDKILKGAKPADIPVEQPTRFELVVNMKTAKALGITIPQSFLIQATQVIE